jgi:hypothetical protein
MAGMDDPKRKLEWAYEHLKRLDGELNSLCTPPNACAITREDDLENERHILCMKLPELDSLALIVGDLFYNMRASLDQLVWSLARLRGIPDGTQFPVLEVLNTDTFKRFSRQTTGVPEDAICEIKFLQPYNRGTAYKTHPLWRLNEMCNLDKHRRIPVDRQEVITYFPGLTPADFATGLVSATTPTDDSYIMSVPLAMKDKLNFDPTLTITIKFGGDISGISESAHGIAEIYAFIAKEVFPRFTRFFP